MSEQKESSTKKSGGRKFLQFLVRLFFIILIGAGIGIGLFYGVSYLTDTYFQSVQTNTEEVAALEARISDLDQLLSDRMDGLFTRLDTLEVLSDTQKQTLSEIEGQLTALETSVEEQQETSAALQSGQENLVTTLEPIPAKVDDLENDLNELETEVSGYSEITNVLDAQALAARNDIETITQKVEWLQVLSLLTRAQVDLSQNNFGLVQQQGESALLLLDQLLDDADTVQATAINNVQIKLIAALDALPDSPLLAASELDAAWNELHALFHLPVAGEETPTTEP